METIGLENAQSVLDVFVKGANVIFAQQFEFTITEVKELHRGNITQQTALIKIQPIGVN